MLSRYADVRFVMGDPRFSIGGFGAEIPLSVPAIARSLQNHTAQLSHHFLGNMAPPVHAHCRRALQPLFSSAAITRVRETIQRHAQRLSDATIHPVWDVVTGFASPLALGTIWGLLGQTGPLTHPVDRWSHEWFDGLDFDATPAMRQQAWFALAALDQFVATEAWADGPLSALPDEHRRAVTIQVLTAGYETSKHAITLAVRTLTNHPEQYGRLRRNPALVFNAVDELLRLDGPVQALSYVAKEDVSHDGLEVTQGERVRVLVGAANRDPEVFTQPDVLDLDRVAAHHLSFAAGAHHCLGASVARVEIAVALEVLLARPFRLVPTATPQLTNRSYMRGYRSFPVTDTRS